MNVRSKPDLKKYLPQDTIYVFCAYNCQSITIPSFFDNTINLSSSLLKHFKENKIMAQGKLKVKAKVPKNVKSKSKQKGTPATKRNNRPIQSKKAKREETQKMKQVISKNVNKAVEAEIRARTSGELKLSKAQVAVADHNKRSTRSKK